MWSVNLVSGVVMVPDNFPRSIDYYKRNVSALMEKLGKEFSAETQVVWLTSPPVAVEVRSGFLVEGMEALAPSMRFNIVEGNQMAAHVVASHGRDVLDLHYWMAHHIHRRVGDGIHWNQDAVRLQLNLILTHFCLSRDLELPGRVGAGCLSLAAARRLATAAVADLGEDQGGPPPKKQRLEEVCAQSSSQDSEAEVVDAEKLMLAKLAVAKRRRLEEEEELRWQEEAEQVR